ncbi:hypothetical protein HZA97_04035 [Candidatus Woesearchaeota archaeon]|nr:hypothetical protein [Candidatus Woesearchaeota archaeon]
MVVNPKNLLETITQDEQKVLRELEGQIDQYLIADFDGEGAVSFGLPKEWSKLRKVATNQLIEKYKKEGWWVELVCDQREGNHLQFTYDPKSE